MLSDFDDFMAAGAEEAFGVIGTTPIKCGNKTAGCVMSPFMAKQELRGTGFWNDVTATAELLRAAAVTLGIVDRSIVVIEERRLKVMQIDDDPHDPCVRLFLKPENQ